MNARTDNLLNLADVYGLLSNELGRTPVALEKHLKKQVVFSP